LALAVQFPESGGEVQAEMGEMTMLEGPDAAIAMRPEALGRWSRVAFWARFRAVLGVGVVGRRGGKRLCGSVSERRRRLAERRG
jgi:hypothetical protein